ncbi:MAG: hypothetical protein HY553_10035 [Elusimicrobia bacterium]|nr:hypothetical protein [Elusimicrobiota bacterium]
MEPFTRPKQERKSSGLAWALGRPLTAEAALKLAGPTLAALAVSVAAGVAASRSVPRAPGSAHSSVSVSAPAFSREAMLKSAAVTISGPRDSTWKVKASPHLAPVGAVPAAGDGPEAAGAANAVANADAPSGPGAGAVAGVDPAMTAQLGSLLNGAAGGEVERRESRRGSDGGSPIGGFGSLSGSAGGSGGGSSGGPAVAAGNPAALRDALKGGAAGVPPREPTGPLRALRGRERGTPSGRAGSGARALPDGSAPRLGAMQQAMTATRGADVAPIAQQHTSLWSSGTGASQGAEPVAIPAAAPRAGGPSGGLGGGAADGAEGGPMFGGRERSPRAERPEAPVVPPVGPEEDRTPHRDLIEAAKILLIVASALLLLSFIAHTIAKETSITGIGYLICKQVAFWAAVGALIAAFALFVIGMIIAALSDAMQGLIFTIMGAVLSFFAVKALVEADKLPEERLAKDAKEADKGLGADQKPSK